MVERTDRPVRAADAWIRDRLADGLRTLLLASKYGALGDSIGQNAFAVEITNLRREGIHECDLRWLLSQSFVKHLIELTLPGDAERTFREGGACLATTSCFVLTAKGFEFAADLNQMSDPASPHPAVPSRIGDPLMEACPVWDCDRRELHFHGALVKRFRLPSPNQTAVLSAFEEENWPSRIDDPLPPKAEQDAKRRLNDTIRNLNRSQSRPLLRFVGDGSGEGVIWEVLG